MHDLDRLLTEAAAMRLAGWDFSLLGDRYRAARPSWDFAAIIRRATRHAASLLDLGTGGGEFLSSLVPLPRVTCATEAWPPNVTVAARRLRPLGIPVVAVEAAPDNDDWRGAGGRLPFRHGAFDVVMSRHESYSPREVARILSAGGRFVTQQVGPVHEQALRSLFGRDPTSGSAFDLAMAAEQLRAAGLAVTNGGEEVVPLRFTDVGALAAYLRMVPWAVADFDIDDDRGRLTTLHERVTADTPLLVDSGYFWLEARQPSGT